MGSSFFFRDLRISASLAIPAFSAKPLPRSARKSWAPARRLLISHPYSAVSITNNQEGVAKGRSASGVRMSRGTSKSRAAPRICSAGFRKPDRRL